MWDLLFYTLIIYGIFLFVYCLVREFHRANEPTGSSTSLPLPSKKGLPRRTGKCKTKEQLITLPPAPPLITEVDVDVPLQRHKPLSVLGSVMLCLLFLSVGVFILGYAVNLTLQGQASQTWPTVQGRIISSAVKDSLDAAGKNIYQADIRYSYKVNSTTYAGYKVSFVDSSSSSQSSAQRIVTRYPVGQNVQVHYNPAQPYNAMLETGMNTNYLLLYAVGGMFTLTSTFFGFTAGRRKLTSRPRFKYLK